MIQGRYKFNQHSNQIVWNRANMKKLDTNKLDSAPLPPLERDRVENIKSTAAVLVWIGPSIVVCIGLYWPEHRTTVARGYYWLQIIGPTLIHVERLVVLICLLNWFIWPGSQCGHTSQLLPRPRSNWIWTLSTDCVSAFRAVCPDNNLKPPDSAGVFFVFTKRIRERSGDQMIVHETQLYSVLKRRSMWSTWVKGSRVLSISWQSLGQPLPPLTRSRSRGDGGGGGWAARWD